MSDLKELFSNRVNQIIIYVVVLVLLISLFILSLRATVTPIDYSLLVPFPSNGCEISKTAVGDLNSSYIKSINRSKMSASIYELNPGETIKEITQALYIHPNTSEIVKNSISQKNHRYFVFSYPSDGLNVKGYLSLPGNLQRPIPLIILLRGGAGLFGLPHPGIFSAQEGYAVVSTTYRGGVSEGRDEYGGDDVNDVVNLFNYLPVLEQIFQISFHPNNKYMVGYSRGGMELFLTLGRYPEIQQRIKKVASITGQLNLTNTIQARPYLRKYYEDNFGLVENDKEWFVKRQPITYASRISKFLPIMIAQGSEDKRICLSEGYDLLQTFHDLGHLITYVEVEGGDHVLNNSSDFIPVLMDWLGQE